MARCIISYGIRYDVVIYGMVYCMVLYSVYIYIYAVVKYLFLYRSKMGFSHLIGRLHSTIACYKIYNG